VTLEVGSFADSGIACVRAPKESIVFPVSPVEGGTLCQLPPRDGVGVLYCKGGGEGPEVTVVQDHNTTPGDPNNGGPTLGLPDDPECSALETFPDGSVSNACLEGTECTGVRADHEGICNSPVEVRESGIFREGDIVMTFHFRMYVLGSVEEWGPDGTRCTEDDIPRGPETSTTVVLTTGRAVGRVLDANNVRGAEIGPGVFCGGEPCLAEVEGLPFDCEALRMGAKTEAKLVGIASALDLASPLGDGLGSLELGLEGEPVDPLTLQ
jgi:hypothetical protein